MRMVLFFCAHTLFDKTAFIVCTVCVLFWLIVHILPNVHTQFLCACTLFVHTACIACAQCTQCELSSATASSTSPTFTLCGRTASHGPTSTLYNSLVRITTCLQCVCHPLPSASYFPSSTSTRRVRTTQSSVFTLLRLYLPYLLHAHYNQKLKLCTSICSKH